VCVILCIGGGVRELVGLAVGACGCVCFMHDLDYVFCDGVKLSCLQVQAQRGGVSQPEGALDTVLCVCVCACVCVCVCVRVCVCVCADDHKRAC
jgi:hypothetical protein